MFHLARVVSLLLLCQQAQSRVGRHLQEQGQAGTLQSFGANPEKSKYPLRACQGDCDIDSDCDQSVGRQICFQRNSGEKVPGCSVGTGAFSPFTDFCVPAFLLAPNYPVNNPSLQIVGNEGKFSVYPLKECMGDCDTDNDCDGDLVCPSRQPGTAVPGCRGIDRSKNDYCVKPSSSQPNTFTNAYQVPYALNVNFTYPTGVSGTASTADIDGAIDAIVVWLQEEGKTTYASSTNKAYKGSDCAPLAEAAPPTMNQVTLACHDKYAANAISDVPSSFTTLRTVAGYSAIDLLKDLRKAKPSNSVFRQVANVAYDLSLNGYPTQI